MSKGSKDLMGKIIEVLAKRFPNLRGVKKLQETLKEDPSISLIESGDLKIERDPQVAMELAQKDPVLNSLCKREEKRAKNNLKSIQYAARELQEETDIAEEMPEDDWLERFFRSSEDISSDDMQLLWGKILAGEIKQPGTFSLRTLDAVRNFSKKEAEFVQDKLQFVEFYYFILWHSDLEQFLNFEGQKELIELGIINSTEGIRRKYSSSWKWLVKSDDDIDSVAYRYNNYILLIQAQKKESSFSFDIFPTNNITVYSLTKLGRDLLSIIESDNKAPKEYIKKLAEIIIDENSLERDYERAYIALYKKNFDDNLELVTVYYEKDGAEE